MSAIPEGYGVIAGRSSKNARAALAAATAAGVDPTEVVAVKDGYLVPDAVLAAFHEAIDGTADDAEATPTSDWKNAEIKDWAAAHEIDLGDATTKADMLDAIAASANEKE
jgi:hypothetical protein